MKAVELFAGVGGFRLGLERTGHEVVWANEFDKYAADTYDKNYGGKIDRRDITTVPAGDIPAHDLICGGFPCQAFSVAGKRRGFDETRGTLFFDIMRIARYHRTAYLFLENVKGLLSHDGGRTFETILKTLDESGYDCQWQVLNSKDFGVPQNRERVFIIGHLRGEPRPEIFPIGEANSATFASTLNPRKPDGSQSYQQDRIYETDGVIPAISSELSGRFNIRQLNGSVHQDDRGIRRLTPMECERLQGFPDNWTQGVSDTQRYKQMGNAVTVNVIEAIAERLPKQSKDK